MKSCISLAIPIMFQNLVVSAVTLVDNLMVGQLGDTAISAVVSANKYYNIMFFVAMAMVQACLIFLAQYSGAENILKVKESFRISIVTAYVPLLVISVIVFIFPSQLIAFLIDDPAIIEQGAIYLRLAAFSYLPVGLSLAIASAMRAVGDAKTPMIISIISIIVNAFLDYGLILGKFNMPALGVAGAAIATIIARFVEVTLLIISLKRGDYSFDTDIKDLFDYDSQLVKSIVVKALPLVINEIMFQFGQAFAFKCISSRGATINAAYSVAITVSDLFYVLFGGMATATTVLVGTKLGANKLQEAKDNAYKILCFSLVLSIFFGSGMILSRFIVPFIYPNISKESLESAQMFLLIIGLMYWITMFNCECYFMLRTGGDTRSTLFMDSGFLWIVYIPILFVLSNLTNLPIYLVYILGQCADIGKAIFSFWIVKKEKWVKNLAVITK